ncbi:MULTISPECIES: multicopper oxidase family protein [Mameliella]|uniref:multicopper oxidase family protein n=1 Tax=Mameliella TaxID=1434019 RepID=UPI000B52D5F7|nr:MULTISPECIES: multicopper oxidase family protein [Mameliella]OWV40307.1 copper oxidase [Mameliella alba]OWV58859.1 copper oxidase [Mameliella alba]
MIQTRREFLRKTAATACALAVPFAADAQGSIEELAAKVARQQLLPDTYPATEIWGYGGTVPAPEIRVRQADRVKRRFRNALPQPSSVHWHGIRIENAMDGVSGLTQDAVAPGGSFDYDFVAPDAGTYWYHAHNRSYEQVARGLRGALIVEEPNGPDIDREEVLLLEDWLLDPENGQHFADFDQPMMMSHGGRIGNFVTTNGRYDLSMSARKNERLRLRIINASGSRIFPLSLSKLEGWTVALDGMPLTRPEKVDGNLILGPAQRMDLIVDVTADEGSVAQVLRIGDDDQPVPQVSFLVDGVASLATRAAPAPLEPNPKSAMPDLAGARDLRLVMAGGAMGRMQSALLGGERLGFRQLAGAGKFWSFNDVAEMTEVPLADLSLNEPVRLKIENQTVFPHAMHLHGMHFRELRAGGALGPMRDTILISGNDTREIAFVADNPGKWLFHCHMLSHAASGMTTWMRVT